MALMGASMDNDFSAMDCGEKVPTHLIDAMVPFLASASQSWFVANNLEDSQYHYTTLQAPSWLFEGWTSACGYGHQVLDCCADGRGRKDCFMFNGDSVRTNEEKATLSLLITFSLY